MSRRLIHYSVIRRRRINIANSKNTRKPFLYVSLLLFLPALFTFQTAEGRELCKDYRLLDGYEIIQDAGLDTTRNWWAITKPFSTKYRLIVNGEETDSYDSVSVPVFSPDGRRWAAFADASGRIQLITESKTVDLYSANGFGDIVYSGNSQELIYSYFESGNEIIVTPDKEIEVRNKASRIFVNYTGSKTAFLGRRLGKFVLNIDGKETNMYDEIMPFGFWHDDRFVYAVKYGDRAEIMRGEESIDETYSDVLEGKVNLAGTVGAFLVSGFGSDSYSVLLSDDYYNPLRGRNYDFVGGLALHPYLPLYAYRAQYRDKYYVVYNNTEYHAGIGAGNPEFSSDGEDLSYIWRSELDMYFSINGVKGYYPRGGTTGDSFAHASGSETYAFTNGTNLVMRYAHERHFHACTMVDATSPARYNRFEDRYEALGIITNKLYLLTIEVPREISY